MFHPAAGFSKLQMFRKRITSKVISKFFEFGLPAGGYNSSHCDLLIILYLIF